MTSHEQRHNQPPPALCGILVRERDTSSPSHAIACQTHRKNHVLLYYVGCIMPPVCIIDIHDTFRTSNMLNIQIILVIDKSRSTCKIMLEAKVYRIHLQNSNLKPHF